MNRKLFLLVIVLLAAVVLPAGTLVAASDQTTVAEVEPNDDFAHATPVVIGQIVAGSYGWAGDYDYYSFEGIAGDLVDIHLFVPYSLPLPEVRLTRNDGTYWSLMESSQDYGESTLTAILPSTGRYELYTWAPNGLTAAIDYQLTLDRLGLYVSGQKPGKAGNVAFGPNDILVRDAAGQWHMVFDGEDVGFTVALNGFEWLPDGSCLMTPATAKSLGTLGMVLPQDVVRFVPTSLGEQTAGQFEWYLRGVDVGLTTAAERIDALALTNDGDLLVSTVGTAKVPAAGGGTLIAADESIMRYQAPGTWLSYFDVGDWYFPGRYKGFAKEDIVAMTRVTPEVRVNAYNADVFFTLNSAYTFLDDHTDLKVKGGKGDILGLHWQHDQVEGVELGAWTKQTMGFPRPITNLSIGPAWTP